VRMESIRMTAPASPARLVIRHSYGDTPIHAIAMAGWHRLVSVGRDNKVRVHNPETGRVLQTFERHSRYITGIRGLDDQHVLLLLASRYGLLDLDSGSLEEFDEADAPPASMQLTPAQLVAAPMLAPATFSPPRANQIAAETRLDSNNIVYVTEDRLDGVRNQYFHIWNVPRGRESRSFWGSDSEALSLIALDAQRVLSSHEDEYFRIWDTQSGEQLRRIEHRCGKAGPLLLIDKSWLLFAPVNPNETQRLYYWQWAPLRPYAAAVGHRYRRRDRRPAMPCRDLRPCPPRPLSRLGAR
jgi:WD40 repeat protein